jgi:CRISPR-associated protein Csh1
MSLAHKLYKIGQLVTKGDIKEIIEIKEFKDIESYKTLQIDFINSKPTINSKGIDFGKTMFTKKIGGSGDGIFYLYPNFEYQKKDLYKSFKTQVLKTFENSVMLYADEEHKKIAQPIWEYIKNYKDDILELKSKESGNYFLIITINGKTLYELMPEIWDNYYDNFVDTHITKKVKKVDTPQLIEEIDFITHKKELCGYNPNVKFFTYDNYHDSFKPQIVNKLPMSKETAIAIKKGWMYAITHLKFYHKGLEYIIIPSIVDFDSEVYKRLLKFLRNSNNINNIASKENSFIRRLSQQIEEFNSMKISLDILFTEVNRTNLSVKIFATLEDVIPSRINQVVKEMQNQKISDSSVIDSSKNNIIYLKDYFGNIESLAKAKKLKGLDNKIKQEKIILSKILLGYEKIDYSELLNRFQKNREIKYNFKETNVEKKLINSKKGDGKVMEWLEYPYRFIEKEDRTILFLKSIDAINYRR